MTISPVKPNISPTSISLPILVGHQPNQAWVARLLGWSECHAEGDTKEAAIAALEHKLSSQLREMEVFNLELPLPKPIQAIGFSGIFTDDPEADEVVAAIAAYRQELDAEESR